MDDHEHQYALGELDRRVGNLMRFGTVAQVDAANALVKIDLGDLTTDWLPWTVTSAGQNRVWHAPDVGEQVILLSPGDPSQGVVLGSIFQDAHPANGNAGKDWRVTFKDGSVVEFDRDGSALNVNVNAAGSIKLTIGGTVLELKNGEAKLTTPKVTVDAPEVTVNSQTAVVNASTSVALNTPLTALAGNLTVAGSITFGAGLIGTGLAGTGNASINGNVTVTGNVSNTGTLTNNGKNVGSTHTHSGGSVGSGTTGAPT